MLSARKQSMPSRLSRPTLPLLLTLGKTVAEGGVPCHIARPTPINKQTVQTCNPALWRSLSDTDVTHVTGVLSDMASVLTS